MRDVLMDTLGKLDHILQFTPHVAFHRIYCIALYSLYSLSTACSASTYVQTQSNVFAFDSVDMLNTNR